MAAEIDAVGADGGDGAGGTNGSVALHEHHASHVAGNEMPVAGFGSGGAALCGDEAVALELAGELAEGFGLIAGEDERRLDGLEGRAGGEIGSGSRVLRQRKLKRGGFVGHGFGGGLRLGMNNVFNGSDAADRFFREDAEFERERAGKFAFEVDGAAAHACDHARVLYFWPFELDENDGLLRAEEIGHDANNFEVELFDLVAGEDGVGIALHAGANFAEGQDFGGGRGLSVCVEKGRSNSREHGRQKEEAREEARHGQMRPSREHESLIIRGEVRGSNQTGGAELVGIKG